jgi:A/G-specific adenine glycosylase
MPRRSSIPSPIADEYPQVAAPALARTIQRRLRTWFRRARRELPWRQTRDPYAIWVSEIMLQQTQVAAVIPYFRRFLSAFPSIQELAAADESQVLRHWEGLGYYQRARNLHRAARGIVSEHGGALPRDPKQLRRMPGVGRYTSGAILSQAFDVRLPIVEANSARVLCRLFACRTPSSAVQRWLWAAAESLLPQRQVGDFNQALMELGALVCTPRQPRCDQCPLRACCSARAHGWQQQIPRKSKPARTTTIDEAALVACRDDRVLLVQRPPTGRWGKLWEFPHGELRDGETHAAAARRLARELVGLRVRIGREFAQVRHGITRFDVTIRCFRATVLTGSFCSSFYLQGRWVRCQDLGRYPMSVPQRKLAHALLNVCDSEAGRNQSPSF